MSLNHIESGSVETVQCHNEDAVRIQGRVHMATLQMPVMN